MMQLIEALNILQKPHHYKIFGALEGTRTPDLLVRSQTLYPAELPAHAEPFGSHTAS